MGKEASEEALRCDHAHSTLPRARLTLGEVGKPSARSPRPPPSGLSELS